MIAEKLGEAYTALEEKYYGVLDFLEDKGVPVYTYNDFLEEKGLPAFPVTVALLILLLAGIYGLFFIGSGINADITVNFSDQFNDSVSGVTVTVKDSAGNIIKSESKIQNGSAITLQGIPIGADLIIVAEKSGFKDVEFPIKVSKQNLTANISLERNIVAIVGEIQLVDQETGDAIREARVSAEWQGVIKTDITDSDGKASFAGIPGDVDILVTIEADGYETLSGNYSFKDGELKEITLVGNSASFSGISSLIISIADEDGLPITGAKVIVRDRETDTSIEEKTIEDSEVIFQIPSGTSVRLTVQKEGFLNYDSLSEDESRTLRQDEEQWPVVLTRGGTRLIVTVFAGQTPMSDATIQLYNLEGEFIEYDITGFGGTAEFTGLAPEEIYVTAYKQGYLPARSRVNVAGTETASINVESADATNSSYVGISVLDAFKAMANNANVTIREMVEGEELPLGIPNIATDISGYASITAKTGTSLVVEAEKEGQFGFAEKLVEANKDNQIIIELAKPIDVIELKVFNAEGNPASGHIAIESVAGALLFDGKLENGSAFFDTEGNLDVIVKVETPEGETFSQKVSIEGMESVEVNLGEAAVGVAPTISLTRVLDEFNLEAEGIVPGKSFWLEFQANWPSGIEKGGAHIRLGQDGIAFVDSEEAGITGFEATTSSFLYSTSYQPLPAPGNETADKQNTGSTGQLNKVLELYFDQPENTIVFKVKVEARNTIIAEEIDVHYRAWSEAGGSLFRTPVDSELGEELFIETKTSFYADTVSETVKIFNSAATCENDLCGNYFFVLPSGLYVDRQEFKAVTEELYSLEIDLSASKPLNVTLKFDTDKLAPKVQFTGYDVDEFLDQAEQNALPAETDLSGQGYLDWAEGSTELQELSNPLGFNTGGETTSTTVTGIGVSPERSRKIRLYFRAVDEGAAEIKMQAIGDSVLNETFAFQVERNKELLVSINPRDVSAGEPFTVKIIDGEDGKAVQEATVQIKDKDGKIVSTLAGRGSTRRGLDGEYYFKNSFDPGTYTLVVTAAGYISDEQELTIAKDGVLEIDSPIKVEISKESREKTISISIHNSGEEEINELGYEIEEDSDFPDEMNVTLSMPNTIAKNQDGTTTIRVTVNLDDESEETLYGEADLVIKGMVAGNYPTKTTARMMITYNKQLDEDCLYFDKEHLQVRLIGTSGSTGTEEFEVENKCGVSLSLRAKIEPRQEDPNLTVTVAPISIEKDGIERIKVTVSNRIERMYDLQSRRDYTIKFESSQISKSIPLSVEIWNPQTNLSYPPSVALWMTRAAAQELAYAQSPIQVLNNGAMPITAFRAAINPEAYMQGITTGIRPNGIGGVNLFPGRPLTPQRFVYAESKKTEALQQAGQGWIYFTGVVGGRQYPDLGRTSLTVNYSGTKCLKATAVDSLVFSSKAASEGTLERTIKVRNECGSVVKLTGKLKPDKIGGNTLVISPPNIPINPGQEQEVKLILVKSKEASRTATVKVVGLLTAQNTWIESNELNITLKLGELAATADGKASAKQSIAMCNDETARKDIAFPILSSDCANGYCDAKQLGEYLVEKADNIVKIANDKVKRAKNQASNFGACATKDFCSFDEMGIIGERFPVYQQLDFMTNDVFTLALKGSRTELKDGYIVLQGAKEVEDIGNAGFDFGQVNLGGNFKGCGKYYVEVQGAVRVINGEIQLDSGQRNYMLSVNIVQDRSTTDECHPLVANVANFLPVDEGFTIMQNYKAWPGFIKSGSEFDSLAKDFANELFKKSDGRYGSSIAANSNKIEIIKGNAGDGLLKIRIPKSGGVTEPMTVYAHVPSSYSPTNTQMTSEIAKAFSSFKGNAFTDKDCWGEEDGYEFIVMKSFTDLEKLYGKLEIKGESSIKINSQKQCIDLNVTSKAPEKVSFSTNFLKKPTKEGIEFIEILDLKGTVLLKEKANGTGEGISVKRKLELEKDPKSSSAAFDNYVGEFRFCVTGNEKFPLAVESVRDISITGEGDAVANRRTEPYKVSLNTCGIHPLELVKKMDGVRANDLKEPETYYATVGWAGEPSDTIQLTDLRVMLASETAKDKAKEKQYVAGQGVPEGSQQVVKTRIANQTMTAIGAYFTGCAGTTAALTFISPAKLLTDILFNCAIPTGIAAKRTAREYGGSTKEVIDTIDKYLKPAYPILSVAISLKYGPAMGAQFAAGGLPFFLDAFADKESETTIQELDEEKDDFAANMINSGLVGGQLGKAINIGNKAMWNVTSSNTKELAEAIADQMTINADLGNAKNVVRTKLVSNLDKQLKASLKVATGNGKTLRLIDGTVLDDVVTKSTATFADDVSEEFVKQIGLGPGTGTGGSNFKASSVGKEYAKLGQAAAKEGLPLQGLSTESFESLANVKTIAEMNKFPTPPPTALQPFQPSTIRGGDLDTAFAEYTKNAKKIAGYNQTEMDNYLKIQRNKWNTAYPKQLTNVQNEASERAFASLDDLGVKVDPKMRQMVRKSYGLDKASSRAANGRLTESQAIRTLRAKKPIQTAIGDAVESRVKVVEGVLKKSQFYDDIDDMKRFATLKGQSVKNQVNTVKTVMKTNWGTMMKNIGLGLGTSIAGQIGGWALWDLYWNTWGNKGVGDEGKITVGGQEFASDRVLLDKPILNITELMNFTTYKIIVSKTTTGRVEFKFSPIRPDDEKALEEMKKYLAKSPTKEWKGDCKKFGRIPAPKLLGTCNDSLIPDEGDAITVALWKAYYDNEETIYTLSKKHKIPQHEIMAVLATSPTNLVSGMPPNWYLEEENKRNLWLKDLVNVIKANGIDNIYTDLGSKNVLERKIKVWQATKCSVKIAA